MKRRRSRRIIGIKRLSTDPSARGSDVEIGREPKSILEGATYNMTPAERELMLACGEFCHVTTADRIAGIEVAGLNPDLDKSIVLLPETGQGNIPLPSGQHREGDGLSRLKG